MNAIVIGSGMGGLSAAIRLQLKGYQVRVFEANSYVGGKVTTISKNGYTWDAGPSLFTMPHLVDELFEAAGKTPEKHFQYKQLEVVCNYFWEDGATFSSKADKEQLVNDLSLFFDSSKKDIWHYLNSSEQTFKSIGRIFLEKSLHQAKTWLHPETIKAFLKIGSYSLNSTLHDVNAKAFSNPKLVQLLDRYATYNGSNPYQTPGIMSMIPYLEYGIGAYFPKGGMRNISQSLYHLAQSLGVSFQFNARVDKILSEGNKVSGVQIDQQHYTAPVVVSNMDVVPTYRKLMPQVKAPEKTLQQERSSSALIFYWGISKTFPELDVHNIFFSDDYKEEFQALFETKTLQKDPTVYIHISSKVESNDAPDGKENWFVMINAPADYGQNWEEIVAQARAKIIAKVSRILKQDIEALIEAEDVLTPVLIQQRTSSFRGALYGAASNNKFAAFLRQANFSNKLKGLYFCGGSVHPGGGIPLSLLSGKIASDCVPKP